MDIPADYAAASVRQSIFPQPAERMLDRRPTLEAVKAIQESRLFGYDRELQFVMDQKSRTELLKIVNKSTGEVLLQLPPEIIVQLADFLKEQR